MINSVVMAFLSAIYCCVLLSCSFVKLLGLSVLVIQDLKAYLKLSRWIIIFIAEHGRSVQEECDVENQSLSANISPLLTTSSTAGDYCLVQCLDYVVSQQYLRFSQQLLKFQVSGDTRPC
jgi:hypothetical protein